MRARLESLSAKPRGQTTLADNHRHSFPASVRACQLTICGRCNKMFRYIYYVSLTCTDLQTKIAGS